MTIIHQLRPYMILPLLNIYIEYNIHFINLDISSDLHPYFLYSKVLPNYFIYHILFPDGLIVLDLFEDIYFNLLLFETLGITWPSCLFV